MGVLAADGCYPVDELRLGAFYGDKAAKAFVHAITPKVRSTLELQMSRQARWEGSPIPEPGIDPFTRMCRYRFVETF